MSTWFIITWSNLPRGTTLQIPSLHQPYTVLTGDSLTSASTKLSGSESSIKSSNPASPTADSNFQPIAPGNVLPSPPYYISPLTAPDFVSARLAAYSVTTLLMDPYTSVNGYSPPTHEIPHHPLLHNPNRLR